MIPINKSNISLSSSRIPPLQNPEIFPFRDRDSSPLLGHHKIKAINLKLSHEYISKLGEMAGQKYCYQIPFSLTTGKSALEPWGTLQTYYDNYLSLSSFCTTSVDFSIEYEILRNRKENLLSLNPPNPHEVRSNPIWLAQSRGSSGSLSKGPSFEYW